MNGSRILMALSAEEVAEALRDWVLMKKGVTVRDLTGHVVDVAYKLDPTRNIVTAAAVSIFPEPPQPKQAEAVSQRGASA